jgi:Uma2 family endonuclease
MATVAKKIEYPTSDGRPMAETDLHRDLMVDVIHRLQAWFAGEPLTYVSGNLLIFYEEGNKRKHVAPDVFAVHGVPKRKRLYYLLWEEGKSPEAVIEITSKTTRKEDLDKKYKIYRDIMRVQEYFLCDPTGDYLKPTLQGHRLVGPDYLPIEPIDGRLPSEVLRLHLERADFGLNLYDPVAKRLVLSPLEKAEQALIGTEQALKAKAAENEELRRQLAELQRQIASSKQ